MNEINNSLPSSKHSWGKFICGLVVSFIIFIVLWFLFSVLKLFMDIFYNGLGLEESGLTMLSIIHPFIFALIESVPFLIFNSILYFFSKKTISFKKGVKWGYLFIAIFFIIAADSWHQTSSIISRQTSLNSAENSGDISSCNKLPDIYAKDECFEKNALANNDPSICSKIMVETKSGSPATRILKDNCYEMIVGVVAEKGDVSYCSQITDNPSLLSSCQTIGVAVKNGDFSCSQVKSNYNLFNYCTAGATKNSQNQQKISNQTNLKTGSTVYTNNQFGFSFEYPQNVSVLITGFPSTSSASPFNNAPVAYFKISDDSQTEGYMTVNISSNAKDVANCTAKLQNFISSSIDGNESASYLSGSGGVNGFTSDNKIIHNAQCFDIQLTAFPSACINSGCEGRLWSTQTEMNILNKLIKYLNTFKFIK
jgi:hypothetical protein